MLSPTPCLRSADFLHMKSLFLQRLLDRGYPLHRLNRWFAEVDHSCRAPLLLRPTSQAPWSCWSAACPCLV
jgi:hypothetical protein